MNKVAGEGNAPVTLIQPRIPLVGCTLRRGRNDDWISKGFSSATALLSNLLAKEVFDELF